MFAAGNDARAALAALLAAGASIAARDRRGRSVLEYAAEHAAAHRLLQERCGAAAWRTYGPCDQWRVRSYRPTTLQRTACCRPGAARVPGAGQGAGRRAPGNAVSWGPACRSRYARCS